MAASRFLESRRRRLSKVGRCFERMAPPQDFWNRAVVAVTGIFLGHHWLTRLKISGIAPSSPACPEDYEMWATPPQDFWNRAVVARCRSEIIRSFITASRFLESRRRRRGGNAAIIQ